MLSLGIYNALDAGSHFTYQLKIDGDRKIALAAKIILQHTDNHAEPFAQQLADLRKTCEDSLITKPKHPTPLPGKLHSQYESTAKMPMNESAHTTYLVKKKITAGKIKPEKFFVFKENPSGRPISEIEAFNADCYRLLLGERHPKVRAVHNTDGVRTGNVSAYIADFVSLAAKYRPLKETGYYAYTIDDGSTCHLSPMELAAQLQQSKIMDIWAAAYLEEENDLHDGNYGFTNSGVSIKIDDDRSTWPLSSKYALEGGVKPNDSQFQYKTAPCKAFPITSRDIRNFPMLIDAKPSHWTPRCDRDSTFISTAVIRHLLAKNQLHFDKYQMFLKRALIPDSVYEALGKAHFRNAKLRDAFVKHKCDRTKTLRAVLVNTPAFRMHLLRQYETALEKIKNDFDEYNSSCKDKTLGIPLDEVRTTMAKMWDDIEEAETAHNMLAQRQDRLETITKQPRAVPIISKPSFFERHAWVKYALIGAAAGLVMIGALAAITFTWGAATPIILGAAKAVGIAIGIKAAVAATATGAAVVSTGIVSMFTIVGAVLDAGFKKLFSEKKSDKTLTPQHSSIPSTSKVATPTVPPRRLKKIPSVLQTQSIFGDKTAGNSIRKPASIISEENMPSRRAFSLR
ncbi:MAG: hypothetical protein ACYC0J_01940 [Gammaproteobacteria bacterium]